MPNAKFIPTAAWSAAPEVDVTDGENLFPQVQAGTYYPILSSTTSIVVPPLTAGSIDQASPTVGDTLTVSGSNATGSATYQWQLGGVDISGATSATYDTTGQPTGIYRRGVADGVQAIVYTSAVSVTGGVVNPEAGLTQDTTFTVAQTLVGNDIPTANRSQPVVFACDFTGLDGSGGGIIFEHGGGTVGTLVVFEADGTFHIRCGNGADLPYAAGTAYIEMPTGQPSGDGTLVWEFNPTGGTVRAWWNGSQIGTPAGSFSGAWTGGDGGSYLGTGIGSSATGSVHGLSPVTVVPYTTASPLRVYFNEASSA